jgi:hypothetical protein
VRLADRNPKWIGLSGVKEALPLYMGVRFACPHCDKPLSVHFRNPIDPQSLLENTSWQPGFGPGLQWERTGDTFETLTLTPSIDFKGHWHGHIISGEIHTS